ncbi:MAG: hypothetical protein R3E50_09390 [Halioglobus sp.]
MGKASAVFGIALLTFISNISLAQDAEVSCKDQQGKVTVQTAPCGAGEELVDVMDSQAEAGKASSGSATEPTKVSCKNQQGKVTIQTAPCGEDDELVDVMD